MSPAMKTNTEKCIKDGAECAKVCSRCSYHCLEMGGDHASKDHQRIMHDCAAICDMAVGFMVRESDHAAHLCRECAEICRACAESCERLANGDSMMTECAETSRRCADSCESMSGVGR